MIRKINSILIILIFIVSCSSDRGVVITSDGLERGGYLRFNECIDRYAGDNNGLMLEFKNSRLSRWEKISIKNVSTVHKGTEIFRFISSGKISGERGSETVIAAKVLIGGKFSLYRYCSARYMSTMFSSKRFDLNIYLLSVPGSDAYYTVPQDVRQFKIFSSEHFSSCPELADEIQNTKFIKKIQNPVPGKITEYEMVDENDISVIVKKINNCSVTK